MEDFLYMKGFSGPREWCSTKVELKPYFEQYSLLLLQNGLPPKGATEVDILQHFVPQSNQLSEEELCTLMDITNASQLTDLSDLKKPLNKRKKGKAEKCSTDDNVDKEKECYDSYPKKSARCFAAKKPNRISGVKWGSRQDILVKDVSPKVGPKDLVVNGNFLVSFRVHEPYRHREREWLRPGKCIQQVTLLDVQPLSYLKDMILCEADFQDVRGDISERPHDTVNVRALVST